jgi:hypothetical protein
MKKIIIAFTGILLAVFIVIKVADAQTSPQETKKCCTEMSKDGAKCPSAAACADKKEAHSGCAKMAEASKCTMAKADSVSCKAKCVTASADIKKCEGAAVKCCEKK